MGSFKNKTKTVEFRHESWAEDSVWYFGQFKTVEDDDAISALVSKVTIKDLDIEALRKAKRAGKKYQPKIESEQLMSAAKALILTMSRGWEGSEFTIPEDWTVQHLDKYGRVTEEPHPDRGQLAPVTEEWVNTMDGDVLGDIEVFLDRLYATKTEEEQESFRESDQGVDGPTLLRPGPEEAPVPSEDFGVQGS